MPVFLRKFVKFKFPGWFSEPVLFEGKEYRLIFAQGNFKKKLPHSVEIRDSKPFLWGNLPGTAKGKTVTINKKKYSIENVEPTGEGYFVYYLGQSLKAYEV